MIYVIHSEETFLKHKERLDSVLDGNSDIRVNEEFSDDYFCLLTNNGQYVDSIFCNDFNEEVIISGTDNKDKALKIKGKNLSGRIVSLGLCVHF